MTVLAEPVRKQLGLARALWWGVSGRSDVVPTPSRWPTTGAIVSTLGAYGVLGILAFDLTLRQHPNVLRAGQVVLRFGHFRSIHVPVDHIASVRRHMRSDHEKTVVVDDDGLAVSLLRSRVPSTGP